MIVPYLSWPGGHPTLEEYAGRVNTSETQVSIAHMHSPTGWSEPGQRPDFDEFTLVLKGWMRVEFEGGVMDVKAGQAVVARKGEWVRTTREIDGYFDFERALADPARPDRVGARLGNGPWVSLGRQSGGVVWPP